MDISKIVKDFEAKSGKASQTARALIENIIALTPDGTDAETKQYLVDGIAQVLESCHGISDALGKSMYNTYREMLVGEKIDLDVEDIKDYTNIAKGIVDKSTDNLAQNAGQLVDTTIKHNITNSMFKASFSDSKRVRFARVPSGLGTCDFCMMLASRGFVYVDKTTAGENNKFHAFCRCSIVPSWESGKKVSVKGYNPDDIYKRYKNGEFGFTSNGTLPKKAVNAIKKSFAMPKIDNPISVEFTDAKLPDKCYNGAWSQVDDMRDFLENVFEKDDCVGTVSKFFDVNGRRVPSKGLFQRTREQIVNTLNKTNNVASTVGRYSKETGAYVRINPLDGQGITDANVKRFAYTLIESDVGTMESQYGKIKALNLPTKAVVTSGNKSVHALVKIDAKDIDEYKERVALLHSELKASGFEIDTTTKNPSRLMRIPGVVRGDGRQALVSINEGAKSFSDWLKWADDNRLIKDN